MKPTEFKDVTIAARVEHSLRDELQQLADENGRKFSDEVRRALRLYVLEMKLRSGEAA
jgi:hypothetical protein